MTKKVYVLLAFISIIFLACNDSLINENGDINTSTFSKLTPDKKTVSFEAFNTQITPVYWQDDNDPSNNFFLAGINDQLTIFNHSGRILHQINSGEVSSIDMRSNFIHNGEKIDLCGISTNHNNHIQLFKIAGDTNYLTPLYDYEVPCTDGELNGFCLYNDDNTNDFYIIYSTKMGMLNILKIDTIQNNQCCFKLVKSLNIPGATGKMITDDHYGYLYAEGNKTLWKYNIAVGLQYNKRKEVQAANSFMLNNKLSGINIYNKPNGDGYIMLTTKNNALVIFHRKFKNKFIKGFQLPNISNNIGTGISLKDINQNFSNGMLIIADKTNNNTCFQLYNLNQIINKTKYSPSS